jgi:uncharacterized membrane protein YdjX (TVP38/TMEM64 family)
LIIGRILILLGIFFFLLTLASNYFDIALQFNKKLEITQLGQLWFYFSPSSLQLTEAVISRYIDPCSALDVLNCSGFIWHPFMTFILSLPAALVLAILSFLFIAFGIKKSRKTKKFNKNKTNELNKIN